MLFFYNFYSNFLCYFFVICFTAFFIWTWPSFGPMDLSLYATWIGSSWDIWTLTSCWHLDSPLCRISGLWLLDLRHVSPRTCFSRIRLPGRNQSVGPQHGGMAPTLASVYCDPPPSAASPGHRWRKSFWYPCIWLKHSLTNFVNSFKESCSIICIYNNDTTWMGTPINIYIV